MKNLPTAPNAALILVAAGWLLVACGGLPMPNDALSALSGARSAAAMTAPRHTSVALILAGMICLAQSLRLAVYSFPVARIRAACTFAAFIIPVVFIVLHL
jgi:hypothetical protein